MFNKFKTLSGKIIVICAVNCIILVVLAFVIVSQSLLKLEKEAVSRRLQTGIHFLDCQFDDCQPGVWHIKDGSLYRGDLLIGDGTLEHANMKPFMDATQKSKIFYYTAIKTSDDGLKWNNVTNDMDGHYLRVAGSTRDANGDPLVGTYLVKTISDEIDRKGKFYGLANVGVGAKYYSYYKALFNDNNEIVGFIVAGLSSREVRHQALSAGRNILIILVILLILSGGIIYLFTRYYANRVVVLKNYLARVGNADFPDEKLNVVKDDLGSVAGCVNEVSCFLKNHAQLKTELSLAADIQAHMLPCIFPPFPEAEEFELYATMTPAKEVGGDFYDFYRLDDQRLAVVIADVSGKGIPAAMVMVIAKTLIKNHLTYGFEPAEAFTAVNKILCEGNENDMFVTAWAGILDTETGCLTYVNAGHNPPVITHSDGKSEFLRSRPGLVLAGMEGIRYHQNRMMIEPGDRLFLYTDGLTEAINDKQELFGETRLINYLTEHRSLNVSELLHGVKSDIDAFCKDMEQFDDMTMLVLDFCKRYKNMDMIEKLFPAEEASFDDANAFLEEELTKLGCSHKSLMQLALAFEEVFINVVHYAYPHQKGHIRIAIEPQQDRVSVHIIDNGTPFNPLEAQEPDITMTAEERSIGGLGILLAKKTVDEVSYEYRNGQNILHILKTIKS